jgi:ubiquitin-conjugating enzyme E2 Z
MSKAFIRRLSGELKEYETQKKTLNEQGIYFEYDYNDLTHLKLLIIGPSNTPYQGGFYFFTLNIPDRYPFTPPEVKFITKYNNFRFHPNLYVEGKVCLSILGTWAGPGWTPCMTIITVALTIQSILTDNPLTNEPSYYNAKADNIDCQNYVKSVHYNNLIGAVIGMIKNIPSGFNMFQNIINNYFINNFNDYKFHLENDKQIIYTRVYSVNNTLNYKQVKEEFTSLISILQKEK